jgi:hypothetical protein
MFPQMLVYIPLRGFACLPAGTAPVWLMFQAWHVAVATPFSDRWRREHDRH